MGGNPGGGRIGGTRVAVWSAKITDSYSSAILLLALTGDRAVAGEGVLRAKTRTLVAATAWSVDLGAGMAMCTGSQVANNKCPSVVRTWKLHERLSTITIFLY